MRPSSGPHRGRRNRAGSFNKRGQAMRSKSPENKLTSNTNSSIERITSRARLPVALTALVTVLSLGTSADAGWLGGRGFGGAGPIGFTGGRVTNRPLGIVNPVGSIGKVG